MICPNCGATIRKGLAFCETCGARVQAAPAPAQRQPVGYGAPPSGPVKRKVSPAVIAAIAIATICVVVVLMIVLRPGEDNAAADDAQATKATADKSTSDDRDDDTETRVLKLPKLPERDKDSPYGMESDPPPEITPTEPPVEITPEESPEPEPVPARDYIIPDSATRLLTEAELAVYSNAELVIARNEIYARHGREFGSKLLRDYFAAKSWYTPRYAPDAFPGRLLSTVENENVALLLSYRDRRAAGSLTYQGSGAADLDNYQVFYDSSSRYLTQAEVLLLAPDDVELAIYEIYARCGMIFASSRWSEYFNSFTWYSPTVPESMWSDTMLNECELANITLLRERN